MELSLPIKGSGIEPFIGRQIMKKARRERDVAVSARKRSVAPKTLVAKTIDNPIVVPDEVQVEKVEKVEKVARVPATKADNKRTYPVAAKIGLRIRTKRKEKGWSQKELGIKAGHTQQICASYEKGRSEHPRYLDDFAAALGCTVEELKTGAKPATYELPETVLEFNADKHRSLTTSSQQTVPLLGVVRAGIWAEPDTMYSQVEVARDSTIDWKGKLYALRVEGQSVNRIFPDGSIVFCAPYHEARKSPQTKDLVHAVLRRGQLEEWTIKILNRREDGIVELWPLSTDSRFQEPFRFDPNQADGETGLELKGLVMKGHFEPGINLIRSFVFN